MPLQALCLWSVDVSQKCSKPNDEMMRWMSIKKKKFQIHHNMFRYDKVFQKGIRFYSSAVFSSVTTNAPTHSLIH